MLDSKIRLYCLLTSHSKDGVVYIEIASNNTMPLIKLKVVGEEDYYEGLDHFVYLTVGEVKDLIKNLRRILKVLECDS